ncbi:hypothetical protein ACP70R_043506 [Stipagrostis hirtigluma subsp. patula]
MARAAAAVLVAALVLCAAVAVSHAGRVLEEQGDDAAAPGLQLAQLEALSPSPSADIISAVPGGVRGGASRLGDCIAGVVRTLFDWARYGLPGGRTEDR